MKGKRPHAVGKPFLPVLVKMAENMSMTSEDAFLCQQTLSAEPQPTWRGAGDAPESRRHRGGTGRERRCFIAVSARGVCQIVSAVKTGRITFRESLKGTDGRAGEKVTSANSGEEPCGLRGCRAARCPGKAGWLYVFGIAREN